MRILFLNPIKLYEKWPLPPDKTRSVFNFPSVTFPQLAATVDDNDCEILDGVVEKPDIKKFKKKVNDTDIVAISIPSCTIALNTEINIKVIRKINPNVKIVIGGHHATFHHMKWSKKGVDFVVRNEGELTFPELINCLENGGGVKKIKGITYNDDGKVRVNQDRPFVNNIDSLPIPKWELLDLKKYSFYYKKNGLTGSIETSRGCSHSCKFCAVNALWRRQQRFKSVDRVLEELNILRSMGVSKLGFIDDNFGANYKRDLEICSRIRKEGLDIDWFSFGRVDSIKTHPDLYESAAKSGLRVLMVGYENLSQSMLDVFQKGMKFDDVLDDYLNVYKFLKRNDIFVYGLFILGYTGETEGEARRMIKYSKKICDKRAINPFRPIPCTIGYEEAEKSGRIISDMFYYDSQIAVMKNFKKQFRKVRNEYLKDFIRPSKIFKMFNGTKNEKDYFRSDYAFILKNILRFTPRKILDFIGTSINGASAEYDYNKVIAKRYLSEDFIERITGYGQKDNGGINSYF